MNSFPPFHRQQPYTFGVVSPASPMRDNAKLEHGIAYLQSLGHNVVVGESVSCSQSEYLAAPDATRIADLVRMFEDPDIDIVICARGGYGTPRLLQHLPYATFAENQKPLLGFSDITALQCALFTKANLRSFSGVMLGVDASPEISKETESWLWKALAQQTIRIEESNEPTLVGISPGIASGTLICGNLCMLCSLLGTEYLPDMKGAILVIEDIGEPVYKVDRYLRQLEMTGISSLIKGVVVGVFNGHNVESPSYVEQIHALFREFANNANIPCVAGLPYGHVARKMTLPFGGWAHIHASESGISVFECSFDGTATA